MELFPHNREAYENAVNLFKEVNRLCIIRPTGTGKSVIIAEFVNQNPAKRHLLLAPGSHIRYEIQKHITNGEISFSTYIGLKMNDALFIPGSFDLIYLDEFHRLGADVWGSAVERLLKHNPDAKVLGTSATHIRYLDDNRNMASEIFNNQIASQMTLNHAIANHILPEPMYISALYSVREEVEKMKRRILSSGVKTEDKKTLIRDLDSKIIDWERSSGLDVVIKKHLGAERRRIIVFCKDWEHLTYAQKILDPIFVTIFGYIESLSLYSKKKDSENENSLKLFTGDDDRSVILYTIDKVNEGLHSKNCNTVILLRDTISPIVFYQQIGRAFSVKAANQPLIVDLVNNFNNIQLESFKNDYEHELNTNTKDHQALNEEKGKAAIEFIDEIQDVRLLFDSFGEKIDVWMGFYEKAKAYFKEHGHFYVPSTDKELQNWVLLQRNKYRIRKLGKGREEKLRDIGMDLDEKIPAGWLTFFFALKEWKKKHDALPTFQENRSLNTWAVRQRKAFKTGELSARQIKMLQNLIRLEDDTRKKDRIDRLIKYFKNGKVALTDKAIQHDLSRVKVLNAEKKLTEETLTALRKANVPIDINVNDYRWLEKAKKVLEYYKENGTPPKRDRKSPIYNFCIKERHYLEGKHPSAKFIESDKEAQSVHDNLQKIISTMGTVDWGDQYAELKKIAQAHGHISGKLCGEKLTRWIATQRSYIKRGKLSPEKMNKLLTIKEVNWYGRSKAR
jgi:Helicase associated domain/Helicase conserved C-terminal domain/Type III restriction enzyme, res subunit